MFQRVEQVSELEMVRVWVLAPGPVLALVLASVPVPGLVQEQAPVLVLELAQHRLLPRRLK